MTAAEHAAARLTSKEELIEELRVALADSRPYAAAKLGNTERLLLAHPALARRERGTKRLLAFELALTHGALRHSGVFPGDRGFVARFAREYARTIAGLDCMGVHPLACVDDGRLLREHGFDGRLISFLDQEPDRSSPSDEQRCYLPLFRGRRLLIVSPFAELLRERATRGTFEAVWRKTGKRWFEPAAVEAVEFPYGFSRATHERYRDVLHLLDEICDDAARVEFDVALIGAGALGAPIAVRLKELGKVAISLGGHLQVLFGVNGRRWRDRTEWQRLYFNDAWIEMPARYRPDPRDTDEDYW